MKEPIGVVGLGLMGSSIAACILKAGYPVTAIVKDINRTEQVQQRVHNFLKQLKNEELLNESPDDILINLNISNDIKKLSNHEIVIESVTEDIRIKRNLFIQLEEVISRTCIIGSNTSAIPVTILQQDLKKPDRLLGMHWAEPAHITKFLEVICGSKSDLKYAKKIINFARDLGKDPSLLKKDIRGFIANRIMYAMIREAFYLVENGYATVEDIDRSVRNDLGYWITFAGPFRFMDLTGIPAYKTVMENLFPELCNSVEIPKMMTDLVNSGAKGTSNAQGFYPYSEKSADNWEDKFLDFSYNIRKLAEKYPQDIGDL